MTIRANNDRGEKNLLTRQRKRSLKALFLFFGEFFFFPVDLRRGANLRVPRWVWSRRTLSKPGRLPPLLTAALIHGAQRPASNKKELIWRLL